MNYNRKIERYVEGRMQGRELEEFRNEIASNPELSKLVEDALRIEGAGEAVFREGKLSGHEPDEKTDAMAEGDVRSHRDRELSVTESEELGGFREVIRAASGASGSEGGKGGQAGRGLRIYWYAAAAVVVAVVITVLLQTIPGKTDPGKLFAEAYSSFSGFDDLHEATRAGDELQEAIEAYRSGHYAEALIILEVLPDSDKNELASFYIGLCRIETGDFSGAVDRLSVVLSSADPRLVGYARWYLGLASLRTGDFDTARKQFSSLRESGTVMAGDAEKILRKMQKL